MVDKKRRQNLKKVVAAAAGFIIGSSLLKSVFGGFVFKDSASGAEHRLGQDADFARDVNVKRNFKIVGDILPGTTATSDLGSATLQFAEAHSQKVFATEKAAAGGTETVTRTGAGLVSGKVSATAGETAKLQATGVGSFASGNVKETAANQTSEITASGNGCFAGGYTAFDATIIASNCGDFAMGCSIGNDADILASGAGAFGMGYCYYSSYIKSTSVGTHAGGSAGIPGVGGYSYIKASGSGAFAHGILSDGSLTASGMGAFASGAGYSKDIIASATSAAQFGPGTNAQSYSIQAGDQVRIKGTTGAPTSNLHNGDIWVNNNYVYIRSNGVSCKVVNNPL